MKPYVPCITRVPKRSVLTVTAVGQPRLVFPKIMPSLYGTAYGTMFKVFKPKGKKMSVGRLVCSYPDAHRKTKKQWTISCELEISDFVRSKDLLQKQPKLPAKLVKRPATTFAEVLYIGPYNRETKTIKALHAFIAAEKLKIAGPHQEVYLSRPGPKAKTIIRYAVKKR